MNSITRAGIYNADRSRRTLLAFDRAAASLPLRALSADAALLERLPAKPQQARLHSVFERVLNVDLGGDRLLTLAHRGADDAPDSVIVDLDRWSAFGLAPGAGVVLSRRRIEVGDAPIELAHARRWQARLPRYPHDGTTLCANLPVARDRLVREGTGIGVRRSADVQLTRLGRAVAKTFQHNAQGVCRALARGDEPAACEYVDQLVGLGPGLTPSGDDFLVGLLVALNLPGSPRFACRRIGVHIVECAGRQTHRISAAALRHAADGRARASLIELCETLLHGAPTRMLSALDRVLRIGSTSGTDIALGALAGFQIHLGCAEAAELPMTTSGGLGDVHGS